MVLACFTIFVQFYLLFLLWSKYGLTFDDKLAYSLSHLDQNCLAKTVQKYPIDIWAMNIALVIVVLLLSVDIHDHTKVLATWKDYSV